MIVFFYTLLSGNPVKEGFGHTCHMDMPPDVLYLAFICNLLHLRMFYDIVTMYKQKLRAQLQKKKKQQIQMM